MTLARQSSTNETVPTSTSTTSAGASAAPDPSATIKPLLLAHATLLALVFYVLLPLGAGWLRWRGLYVHAALQLLAVAIGVAGLGLAITLSLCTQFSAFREPHQVLGLIVLGLLLVQGPVGYGHHVLYKSGKGRTALADIHVWMGRVIIAVGMVNAVL